MYADGHVDIFDMIDIDLPLTTLDKGLYALACEEDVHCLATATIEDITELGSSAAIEHKSEKILLLTWHDSSAPTKEFVCDFVTPRSLPQHDSSTPYKNSLSGVQGVDIQDNVVPTIQSQFSDINLSFVSQQATASNVIEYVMRQLSFEKTEVDGEAGFSDVAVELPVYEVPVFEEANVGRTEVPVSKESDEAVEAPNDEQFFHDVEGVDSAYETQYDVESSEDAGTGDDDDEDDDFLVDEENEIV
ncbi:hypothetical protein Tco_0702249 [Tanacetum coccineum]|uniref:Uncharacterized protein n=1 Tax=Tanacetum coccineum TaxID=301880 RepID=A0ABQ4XXE0_9ASTR